MHFLRGSVRKIKPLFYHCSNSRQFWTNFESYCFIKSTGTPVAGECFIWNNNETIPFTKFIQLLYYNWKIVFVGLHKKSNYSENYWLHGKRFLKYETERTKKKEDGNSLQLEKMIRLLFNCYCCCCCFLLYFSATCIKYTINNVKCFILNTKFKPCMYLILVRCCCI